MKTTKDEFTALHFVSFNGNLEIIQALMKNGADKHAVNKQGLNMLHIAAQGNQAISLYYFKSLEMDIYSRDSRNSTPLHWACFSNSEVALNYLLAWYNE